MRASSIWYPLLGLAFAVAGGDKLLRDDGYDRMYRRLGWSPRAERWEAGAEVLGGLMLAAPASRRLGGVLLSGASAAMLASEVRAGSASLAVPRLMLLAAALAAAVRPGGR